MDVTSRVYQWHSQFNVYVLDNQDVLLLSPGQQLLLPQIQFPFVNEINGNKSVGDILNEQKDFNEKSSLFLYQINKLLELQLIEEPNQTRSYIKPCFKNKTHLISIRTIQKGVNFLNLSECHSDVLQSLIAYLEESEQLRTSLAIHLPITLALVDDFLDPRLADVLSDQDTVLIKLTGDAISISPVFKSKELNLFIALQKQLLDNQPVRKMLEAVYPDAIHAYPFEQLSAIPANELGIVEDLLTKQLSQTEEVKQITIFRKQTGQYEYHIVNQLLDNTKVFSKQINDKLVLNSCISHFNIDGGSRNVSAQKTVDRLMPLVSPITGVINHLEVIGEKASSPIKIYRTGFFKQHTKTDVVEFDRNSFVQICLGKGVSHAQSMASALSEAIERYAALYQGDVDLLSLPYSKMIDNGHRVYDFQSLVPYSQSQYVKFNQADHPDSKLKQAAKPYKDEAVHWLPTWSLTKDEKVYVPLSHCFSNIPFEDDAFGRWHSNGCAAGNTLEEAILQAMFELIERDATAIWWYNQLSCPKFELSRLNSENLKKLDLCLSPSESEGHKYWVLDITSDIGIPVMGAIGQDKQTGGLVMGFGCHLIPEMAAQRALTELCQLIPIREQNAAPFDFDKIDQKPYLFGEESLGSTSYAVEPSSDIKDDILNIVAHLKEMSFETLVLNYSRAQIPLNTAKVFVPGLCHIWPQLANERLYKAPINMGLIKQANDEQSINQQPLYI